MKKDIEFPENKNLHIAIAQDGELWEVVLINNGQEHLRNILVASTGYGLNTQGEKIQTSTLRHFFEELSSEQFLIVEKIDPAIFHLTNEYWVSYWIQDGELWEVVLINNGQEHLRNILVASTGYGLNEQGEKIQTSTLRHFFEELAAEQFLIVEKIDPAIFHLTNEYWVSYWIQDRLYDRCFLFVPESINTNNLVEISILGRKAVLHA